MECHSSSDPCSSSSSLMAAFLGLTLLQAASPKKAVFSTSDSDSVKSPGPSSAAALGGLCSSRRAGQLLAGGLLRAGASLANNSPHLIVTRVRRRGGSFEWPPFVSNPSVFGLKDSWANPKFQ